MAAAAELMQQARKAIREGRLVDARRLLRQVIHEEPKNHAAWLLLARATPDKKLASEYIDRASLLQPDSPLVQGTQEDLASNKTAATNKFSYSWLLIPLLVGSVLILGLLGISYIENTPNQVVIAANESADRIASAPAKPDQNEPSRTPETESQQPSIAVTNSPRAIASAVPSDFDGQAIEETDESQDPIFEPVVISDSVQALPAAILLGIDAEGSSSEPLVTPEEELAISAISAQALSDGETSIESSDDAETVDANDFSDIADSVNEAGIEEEVQVLKEPESDVIAEDKTESEDPVQVETDERWIDVNLTTQTLTAYEGDTAVLSSLISSGMWQFPTVTGQFRTWIKYESQNMTGYHLGYNYSLDDVPHVMYFFKDYAIHGAYWHNNFGTPMSHGCVNVNLADAEWLYNWAPLGTLVNVHY
jgi:lipoprotein-anchoring transpeptidase ErfK/SrfK